MKEIPLTQNQYALVDDADYGWLNAHKWCATRRKYTFYPRRKIQIEGKPRILLMHRFILGLSFRDGKEADHIDHNGLNNQRANLRICSKAGNQRNQRIRTGGSSQYKGVHWCNRDKIWVAQIHLDGKKKHLGGFHSEIKAALTYNRAAKNIYGKYAWLNSVKET